MTREQIKRGLGFIWWWQLGLTLAPLIIIDWMLAGSREASALAMPLFIAGLLSMFVSLPLFRRFKHQLIATQKALDTDAEPQAWLALAKSRRLAFLAAGLPAWIAAVAVFAGLEAIPQILLALASVVLLYLYRIPRQLG
ncbi:MAG: MFS transporter [Pseudomonadaceae bacterium]|uniref:MFS transporter n=1 Tax=Pseudomonas marincola TaxID=437900 RepID=UPI0008540C0E|nr:MULTISPECIES: MFS transporter [Pseudomonas]MBQ54726.1 MFS transporter [Pseudomonadaceae bacterium]OEO23666.1 MFS transporter [Pseudomonas sp. J237]SFU14996.1 hypothetical protein SAMN05216264_11542 [Pseudomonas marincola]HCP53217.1 MFS transporter [Pseudomonas sp.]